METANGSPVDLQAQLPAVTGGLPRLHLQANPTRRHAGKRRSWGVCRTSGCRLAPAYQV